MSAMNRQDAPLGRSFFRLLAMLLLVPMVLGVALHEPAMSSAVLGVAQMAAEEASAHQHPPQDVEVHGTHGAGDVRVCELCCCFTSQCLWALAVGGDAAAARAPECRFGRLSDNGAPQLPRGRLERPPRFA
jgi:hypothetical protein